jgi:hypothetical protein
MDKGKTIGRYFDTISGSLRDDFQGMKDSGQKTVAKGALCAGRVLRWVYTV